MALTTFDGIFHPARKLGNVLRFATGGSFIMKVRDFSEIVRHRAGADDQNALLF